MNRLFFLLLLAFGTKGSVGQTSVTGTVLEALTEEPLSFATVYIDGTTRGTTTNENGSFELSLEGIDLPAQLVVSYLGYQPLIYPLKQGGERLKFLLESVPQEIGVIEVIDQNQRERNLAEFRRRLLGPDEWGAEASILNEESLVFRRENHELTVTGREPLQIELPHSGYRLRLDLKEFTVNYQEKTSGYLGTFFFSPEEGAGKPKRKHARNRKRAFYGSPRHFGISLLAGTLPNNGFQVWKLARDTTGTQAAGEKPQYLPFELAAHIELDAQGGGALVGLQGEKFLIHYHFSGSRAPLPPKRWGYWRYEQSRLIVMKDRATVNPDGTLGDLNLLFDETMGAHGVARALPSDFTPATPPD